jgi:phytoene dehydrogenase-like protein
VILGSDPDGLTAAIALARSGYRVLVADEQPTAGGVCAPDEFHPGFVAPGLLHELPMSPAVATQLRLVQHGLELIPPPAIRVGDRVVPGDPLAAAPELGPGWAAHREWVRTCASFLGRVARGAAPPISRDASLWPTVVAALGLRRLGATTMSSVLRRGPLSLKDFLEEFMDDPAVMASLALTGLAGTRLGPLDPITTPALLFRAATAEREPAGGGAGLVAALLACASAEGVTVRTGVSIDRIRVGPDHADGVEIDGHMEDTNGVFAAGSLAPLVDRWLDPLAIPDDLAAPVAGWRARGDIAVVRLALSAPLSVDGTPVARLRTASDLMVLERARDAVKYRGVADVLPLDARQWSAQRAGLAPPGQHVVTVHAHGVSVEATRSWSHTERDALGDRVIQQLEQVAPGVRDAMLECSVLTPADLEQRGLHGGHLWQGELAFDQLWITRPARRLSQYHTGIPGLFLCSSATHPAPFSLGGSGVEAAAAALEG